MKARGEVRTQYAHAIDMMPTVLELIGIEPPASIKGVTQAPIEGVSFAHSLDDAEAESNITPSILKCWATAPSTTMAGGRSAPGPDHPSRKRAPVLAIPSRPKD